MTNIVLIGMPGSGKTTIGQEIGRRFKRKFIDLDHLIEKESGQSIADLFEKGEIHFRQWESRVTKQVAQSENQAVIATGGGIILRKENMSALKNSGAIIFIDRPLDLIIEDVDRQSRPLLKEGVVKLIMLYRERIDLYREYADLVVRNDGSLEEVVGRLEDEVCRN